MRASDAFLWMLEGVRRTTGAKDIVSRVKAGGDNLKKSDGQWKGTKRPPYKLSLRVRMGGKKKNS